MATVVATGATPVGNPFAGLGEAGAGIADVITGRREKKADEEIRRAIIAAGGDRRKLLKITQSEEFKTFIGNATPEVFNQVVELMQAKPPVRLAQGDVLARPDPVPGELGDIVARGDPKTFAPSTSKSDTNLVKAGQLTPAASNSIRGATTTLFDGVTFDPLSNNVIGLEPEDAANFLEVTTLAGERILSGQDKDVNAATTNAFQILQSQFASEQGPELASVEKSLTPEQKIDLENARSAVEKGAPEEAIDELLRSKGIDPRLRKKSALDKLKDVFK